MTELLLERTWLTTETTIGRLFVAKDFECYVLEDRYRPPGEPKVYGKTCIPNGRYEVRITMSPRFKREMPLLIGVPGFEGVRIHPGNKAADTEGCLLPGRFRTTDFVGDSVAAYATLFAKLKALQGPTFITITTVPGHV